MQAKVIWIFTFISLVFILFFISSCKKEDKGKIPVLSTKSVSYITQTTVTCGWEINNDGGASITAKGVCWSVNITPTIADRKTINRTDARNFSDTMTDLNKNTRYFVRAYATNIAGTGYGNVMTFIAGTVIDVDGNLYHTVTIGTQVWMVENLKVTHYRNGDSIANIKDASQWCNLTTGAYCDYDNTSGNGDIYGKLYNYWAIWGPRFITPKGWHVPSNAEWSKLDTFLGNWNTGSKLKESGLVHWNSPNIYATNESGFTALPGGCRDKYGRFWDIGNNGYWWSTTGYPTNQEWGIYLFTNAITLKRLIYDRKTGFSIRCLRDY